MTLLNSLDGLCLLVTRPRHQADSWAQQLRALGATVFVQPMMEIAPLVDDISRAKIVNLIQRLDEYQKVIFVSQNAVCHGVEWIDQYWPQLPVGIDFFAIGKMTAKALMDSAIMTCAAHIEVNGRAMNSESLLAMESLHNIANEKILIFRGRGGRTHLGDCLIARGAYVDYCESYQRKVPDRIGQQLPGGFYNEAQANTVTVVHSGETLENLVKVVTPEQLSWLKQQPLLLPGQRVATIAKSLGFNRIIMAENATHEGMIEALYEWQKEKGL